MTRTVRASGAQKLLLAALQWTIMCPIEATATTDMGSKFYMVHHQPPRPPLFWVIRSFFIRALPRQTRHRLGCHVGSR